MNHFPVVALLLFSLSSLTAARGPVTAPAIPSLDLKSYLTELDRWSATAATLKEHPEKSADLRKTLPRTWEVNIRRQHFTVPTDWLRRTLDSLEMNHSLAGDYSKEMQGRLAAMRAEAEAMEKPSALGAGVAQSRRDEILRRREFSEVQGPNWWDRLRERISNWIADFLLKIFGGLGGHPDLTNLLLWVILAGLVSFLMVALIRYFLRSAGGAELDLKGPLLTSRTGKDWEREALSAAGRGDYREAIRLSYWAGIYRLEELGMWPVDRSRTHREYLRLLAADDTHRPPLATLTSQFELVWYGGNAATVDDFESVLTQLERLGCNLNFHAATANS